MEREINTTDRAEASSRRGKKNNIPNLVHENEIVVTLNRDEDDLLATEFHRAYNTCRGDDQL